MSSNDNGCQPEHNGNPHRHEKVEKLTFEKFSKELLVLPDKHRRAVASIGLDSSGVRMFTAGYDHNLKLWEKGLLFREDEEPFGTYPLRAIGFSSRSEKVLIIPRSPQPALVTRDGRLIGDPYLLDKRKTIGHSGAMCGGQWHPVISECFVTGSVDGTIRTWDAHSRGCASVIMAGPRIQLSAVSWLPDGSGIMSGSNAGLVQLWVNNKKQASLSLPQAALITSIAFTKNESVAIRSMDGFIRLWDMRKLSPKEPLASVSALPTAFEEADLVLSPDGALLATGISNDREGPGSLKAFDSKTLELKEEAGVVRVAWDSHQLVMGLSDGSINLFTEDNFTPRCSSSSVAKKAAQKGQSADLVYADVDINAGVYAPETDPLYDEDFIDLGPIPTRKRPDPIATKRPELPPIYGPGKGGKIGTSISQHILKHFIPDRSRDDDPREALLKYAKIAEEDPKFVTPAYTKTQPKPIFAKPAADTNK
ncbi:hypothetical protein MDAP_002176 [Mitosporidium daphniae]